MDTSINLLLVEDDLMLAAIEKKQLNEFGYTVHHVTSGEGAVDVGLADPSIDLILMDINLSTQMDGTQAAEIILKQRDIPVLFLSSHTEPEVVDLTEKITSYDYVVKNTGITVLDASIKMALKLYNEKQARKEEIERRIHAEKVLSDNDRRLRMMIESIPVALYLTDEFHTKVEYVNPYFKDLLGYTTDDLPTIADWMEKAYPDDEYRSEVIAETMSNIQRAVEKDLPFIEMSSMVTCKNGSQKHILWKQVQIENRGLGCGLEIKPNG